MILRVTLLLKTGLKFRSTFWVSEFPQSEMRSKLALGFGKGNLQVTDEEAVLC